MTGVTIALIAVIALLVLILLINPKVYSKNLLKQQFGFFYNAKSNTKKLYLFDLISFIICPIGLSLIFVFGLNYVLTKEATSILLTIFSLFFSITFSVFAFLSRFNKSTNLQNKVAKETIVALFSESEFSLVEIMVLLITYFLIEISDKEIIISEWVFQILTTISLLIAFLSIALILIVIKRVFLIMMSDSES